MLAETAPPGRLGRRVDGWLCRPWRAGSGREPGGGGPERRQRQRGETRERRPHDQRRDPPGPQVPPPPSAMRSTPSASHVPLPHARLPSASCSSGPSAGICVVAVLTPRPPEVIRHCLRGCGACRWRFCRSGETAREVSFRGRSCLALCRARGGRADPPMTTLPDGDHAAHFAFFESLFHPMATVPWWSTVYSASWPSHALRLQIFRARLLRTAALCIRRRRTSWFYRCRHRRRSGFRSCLHQPLYSLFHQWRLSARGLFYRQT